ncbi:MAG: trimethylamine methyltransferase family protein, partial [Anaerolineales bacterium]|nr:trimethylamine methyltransferase family protein [Anaerolineales bacterium]
MRPSLNILSPSAIQQILDEALRILGELGIEVRGKALRQRLLDHGLQAAADGRILFPEETVRWAIEQAPPSFKLYDRDGRPHAHIGGDDVHFIPASSGLKILDHRTGDTR